MLRYYCDGSEPFYEKAINRYMYTLTDAEMQDEDPKPRKIRRMKQYRPPALRGKGNHYADGGVLHGLLMDHRAEWLAARTAAREANPGLTDRQLRVRVPIGNKLGGFILKMVDETMVKGSYWLYSEDWKEMMRHEALCSCILYCHNYDPEKAAIRRAELNLTRAVPLEPIPPERQAWNYLSWIMNQAIGAKIVDLKAKEALAHSVGLGKYDYWGIDVDNQDLIDEKSQKYNRTFVEDCDDDEAYDPIADIRKIQVKNAEEIYRQSLHEARNNIAAKYPENTKLIRMMDRKIAELMHEMPPEDKRGKNINNGRGRKKKTVEPPNQ